MKCLKLLVVVFFILFLQSCAFENENRIVILELDKKSDFDAGLEYDSSISGLLTKNKLIADSKFMNQSIMYLEKVRTQHPNPANYLGDLFPEYPSAYINPGYNVSKTNETYSTSFFEDQICKIGIKKENLSQEELFYEAEDFINYIYYCIKNETVSKNGNYVFVGNDHAMSYFTFRLAKEIDAKSKIGLFVFDEHVDIYDLKDSGNLLNKANIFGKLILEGYVDYAIFLHISDRAKEIANSSTELSGKKDMMFSRISVYSSKDLEANYEKTIENEISRMKEKGVNTIMVSFDVDALPIQYTGFEYSVLAPGIAAIRYGNISRNQTLAEFEDGFSEGIEPAEFSKYISTIKKISKKKNIKFGAGNNVNILGDFQEILPGQDMDNETTIATREMAAALMAVK